MEEADVDYDLSGRGGAGEVVDIMRTSELRLVWRLARSSKGDLSGGDECDEEPLSISNLSKMSMAIALYSEAGGVVSLMCSNGVVSCTHPVMMIGATVVLSLRNRVIDFGILDRLSVAMAKHSRSKDETFTKGRCAKMRPKEEVITTSSLRDQI
jgi:hypothetical protein